MSDCEETDLFWASLISPGKRKRKKDSKKDKKCKKKEQTDEMVEKKKKKKNSKFKDAMAENKLIKKQKKKKKNRSALELVDEEKPQKLNPSKRSSDELKPDKKKRKKKVSFDLSPGVTWAIHPKSIPSSSQRPKESVLLEDAATAAVNAGEFTVSGQTHDDDSQLNSEDINSQDLFITQKTFRASPSEPSSSEASDEVIPRTLSPQIERDLEGSYKRPRESHLHQRHGKMNEQVNKPRTLRTQEEERSNKVHHEHKKGKFMDKEDKKVPCPPVHVKQEVLNPFLDDSIDETPSLHVTESKTSTSTQTENLFTTELSSYLNFCRRVTVHSDDLKPLDLSLPQRARKDSLKINRKDPNPHPSGAKDIVVKKEPSRRSLSTPGKSKTSLTPQLESDTKCAETTNSSDDNESTNRSGKLELTQARAVQTKLNESFFFKTKGDGQSPRPESPLMKLAQGRDVKMRKGRVT